MSEFKGVDLEKDDMDLARELDHKAKGYETWTDFISDVEAIAMEVWDERIFDQQEARDLSTLGQERQED